MGSDKERFEKWAKENGYYVSRQQEGYLTETQYAYEGWQAAKQDASLPVQGGVSEELKRIMVYAGSCAEGPNDPEFSQFLKIEADLHKALSRFHIAPVQQMGELGEALLLADELVAENIGLLVCGPKAHDRWHEKASEFRRKINPIRQSLTALNGGKRE